MKVMGFAGAGVGLFPGIHHRRELFSALALARGLPQDRRPAPGRTHPPGRKIAGRPAGLSLPQGRPPPPASPITTRTGGVQAPGANV